MPDPDPRDAPLDIVRRLEAELVALEHALATLDTNASAQERDIGSEPRTTASARRAQVGRRAPGRSSMPLAAPSTAETDSRLVTRDSRFSSQRSGQPANLTPEEHRRLARNLEAVLEEVRQLADFLAGDERTIDR